MIEQEIVEEPDLAQLATVENPKTKEAKQAAKKKSSLWPLLALGAGGVLWYLWDKKKKALILARQIQLAQAQAQQKRNVNTQKQPSGNENSAEARLLGMGINTSLPGAYQGGESYKEV